MKPVKHKILQSKYLSKNGVKEKSVIFRYKRILLFYKVIIS